MNRKGGVRFRDLEEPRQGQGGMHSIVHLGNCTSFMLLGFDGRGLAEIWRGGNQIIGSLMFMLQCLNFNWYIWEVIVVFLNRRRVPDFLF